MSVWMMPGQGAQKVGMGADLLVLPEVQETFEMAKAATGIDLITLSKKAMKRRLTMRLILRFLPRLFRSVYHVLF